MSPKLKVLSGTDVLAILKKAGFQPISQRGSHVKLRRISSSGERQTLTIVLHKELDKGTLKAIYRQALRYVSEDLLYKEFYTK